MILNWLAKRWLDRIDRESDPTTPITDADLATLEDPKNGIITIEDEGVIVRYPRLPTSSAKWADITEVFAYKRDLLATDMICLALCTSANVPVLEPNAEMQGFVKVWRELNRRLPGFAVSYRQWLLHSPAFDTQPTSVWKKEA